MSDPRAASSHAVDCSRRLTLTEPANPVLYRSAGWLKRLLLLRRSLRLQCAVLGVGDESALYLGEGETLSYLRDLHGISGPPARRSIAVTRLPSEIMRHRGESLLYIEVNRLFSGLIPSDGFRTLPWIRQKIRLGSPDFLVRVRGIEGVYGRKARRLGLDYQLTQDRGALEEFYHEFYCPYIRFRFDRAAHLRSFRELKATMRSGFLLKVLHGRQWLAGAVCRLHGAEVLAVAFGLRGDYADLLRRGMLSAAYYFLVRWALDHSVRVVDLLRSRPHAEDGVFVHKRRFGATPGFDSWPHCGIWIFPARGRLPALGARGLLVWRGGRAVTLAKACILHQERQG